MMNTLLFSMHIYKHMLYYYEIMNVINLDTFGLICSNCRVIRDLIFLSSFLKNTSDKNKSSQFFKHHDCLLRVLV